MYKIIFDSSSDRHSSTRRYTKCSSVLLASTISRLQRQGRVIVAVEVSN